MDHNENFAAEQVTENVEQTTEQTPKLFTQEEVNEIVGRSKARTRAKVEREYQRKYGDFEAGTGDSFRAVQMPRKDIEVLAKADAEEFISAGYDEVVGEVDRLAALGDKMTEREKEVFKTLAEHRQNAERVRELSRLGAPEEVCTSREFQDFAGKFNSNTPIADIYDLYSRTQPRKTVRTMGSMKNSNADDAGVKDFYTRDEALKFSKKDFDRNPALFKAVEASMLKW